MSHDTAARWRAAIIGTGRIASLLERDPLRPKPHTHAGWYHADPRTALVAGADVDAERLAAFGRDWTLDASHLHQDYRAMLLQERPDVVSVCAYAADRLAMCREAVAAGARGLWIEKAAACSVEDGEVLASLVERAGVAAVVDHPRRLEARYRAVGAWLAAGALGRLESVHVLFSGHVVHTGTHAWDLLLAWCGPWARVEATLDTPTQEAAAAGDAHDRDEADVARYAAALRGGIADRGGRARIVFANGVEAFVTGGAKGYFVFQLDAICSRGRIRLGNDAWEVLAPAESPRYTGYRELAAIDPLVALPPGPPGPASVLDALLLAMTDGREPELSVRAAVDALALGIAIVQAGLTGQAVTPETLDRALRIDSI